MYIKQAKLGGFISPIEKNEEIGNEKIGTLNGYYGIVKIWLLPIPEEKENFKEFCNQMAENENKLKEIMLKEKSLSNSYAS